MIFKCWKYYMCFWVFFLEFRLINYFLLPDVFFFFTGHNNMYSFICVISFIYSLSHEKIYSSFAPWHQQDVCRLFKLSLTLFSFVWGKLIHPSVLHHLQYTVQDQWSSQPPLPTCSLYQNTALLNTEVIFPSIKSVAVYLRDGSNWPELSP